jgi:hypothetical protein
VGADWTTRRHEIGAAIVGAVIAVMVSVFLLERQGVPKNRFQNEVS